MKNIICGGILSVGALWIVLMVLGSMVPNMSGTETLALFVIGMAVPGMLIGLNVSLRERQDAQTEKLREELDLLRQELKKSQTESDSERK